MSRGQPQVDQGVAAGGRSSARFPGFDGLRVVAALCVFAYHIIGEIGPSWLHGNVQVWVLRLGVQGVGIFFVISGFLLYRPFVEAALRGDPAPATLPFLRRRFARIFPAYWLALSAFAFVFGFITIHGVANTVTYYGLLQNYRAGYKLNGLAVAWTLVIELTFYLAVPLIAYAARAIAGSNASGRRVLRVHVGIVGTLAALSILVRAYDTWVMPATSPAYGSWFPLTALGDSIFAYLDWFAIGMAFAIIVAWSTKTNAVPRGIRLLSQHAGASWLIALVCYAAQTRLHLAGDPGATTVTGPFAVFLLQLLIPLTAGFLVFPVVFSPQNRAGIRWLLRTRPMSYFGSISYGFYLWHYTFIDQSERWVASGALPNTFVARLGTVFLLTTVTAAVSFHFIEQPIIRLAHRRRPHPSPERSRTPLEAHLATAHLAPADAAPGLAE